MVSTNVNINVIKVSGFTTGRRIEFEKLQWVKFDQNIAYNDHISGICEKASSKISILAGVTLSMKIGKKRMLMKVFHLPAIFVLRIPK